MLILIITVFTFFQINGSFESDVLTEREFSVLTRNLIENFRVDPFLNGESTSWKLSQTSKEFIDEHIERYSQLVLTSREREFSRSKRSLDEWQKEGETQDLITEINHYGNVSAFDSGDIKFFQQNSQWYAVSIGKKTNQKGFNLLLVLKYENEKFKTIAERDIQNGVRIAAYPIQNSTLIVVADNSTILNYTNIYEFTYKEEFEIIHKVNGSGYHDVSIWEDNGNVFMSLVGFMANSPVSSSSSRLYKWRGRHFDVLQNIHDTGVTRITPFQIGDEGFLAVARNQPLDDEENIYSEILKYNVETEKYELLHKILTYACEDIKYFEIDTEGVTKGDKEGFLIVANFYEKDSFGKRNYQTTSIIYKFLDDYFFPFQSIALTGVRQWEPIKNENGEVLLVALTMEGLRTFAYDGWRFIENKINFKGDFKNHDTTNIKALHSYRFDHKNLLVVVRENPSTNDHLLFDINFSTKNKVRQIHNELLSWCQDTTKRISEKDEDILERVHRGDMDEEFESESQTEASDSEKLTTNINNYNLKLFETASKLKKSLQSFEPHIIERNLEANHVHINSTGQFESVTTEKIGNKHVDSILNSILDINEGFQIDSEIEIDFLRTDEDLEPKTFNGHPVDSIIYRNAVNNLKNVKILGSAIFKDDVTIGNINNDVKIQKDSILLKTGDQNLRNLKVMEVRAEKVHAKILNGHHILTKRENNSQNVQDKKLRSVKSLKTKILIVEGFINDVDVPTLEKYALRKSGKQDITAETYYFDRVESELLDTDRLSGIKIPEDLILINTGDYDVPKSLLFINPLTVNNLTALRHLDSITVSRRGTLDLLLKDVSFQQHVTGMKSFRNVETLNPIDIRGKLKGKDFENLNPLKKIQSNVSIENDVIIGGSVLVEDFLKSTDVISNTSHLPKDVIKSEDIISKRNDTKSIARVVKTAVKLMDDKVNVPVAFLEHLSVTEVNADSINGVDPENLVITGAKHAQIITGWKTFKGDLEITGNTNVSQINSIDTEEFENNILKTDGDQVISGKHEVDNVIVVGKLKTNSTKFGTKPWKDVITSTGDQTIHNFTVFDFSANSTSVKNIEIEGEINGIDFSKMVHDAAVKDVPLKISGTKNFTNLNINHLWVQNNFDMKKKIQELENKNLTLENIDSIANITAEKVYFNGKLNGVDKTKFQTVTPTDKIEVEGEHEFDEVSVSGTVFIETNQINQIDLDDVEENSVKTDLPQVIQNVQFDKIFVPTSISHNGQIENLDLDNVFENKEKHQNVLDKIDFREGLSVTGTINIDGRLNGVKVSDLCGVTSEINTNKKLTIEGNVHFVKGPRIAEFNGISEKDLNSVWFTDKPAKLKSNIAFLGNVTMREDTTLQGLLNGLNVKYLSENYLSKTKDQKIAAHVNFLNTTIFLKDVTTPHMFVGRKVNEINFKEFSKIVLLHRPQLFEDVVYFEEITTKDLEGNYLVNKLNLDSEVMRYDSLNLITGPKSFGNLDVDVLRPEREGATVQEVDVAHWLEGAVLIEGSYKIGGRKKFANIEIDDSTNLVGRFNDMKMNNDTVMLKHVPQNITGIKTFAPKYPDELKFKAIKLKGLINDDDLIDVLNNQANQKVDNDFDYPLDLHNKITTKNVNFMEEYHGINIEKLLKNISTIRTLSHIKEKYQDLMDMNVDVEKSLKNQAFFFEYFKTVPSTFDVTEMFSLNCGVTDSTVISFKNKNDSNDMMFLDWDKMQEIFISCCSKDMGQYPNYMNKINVDGMDAIYMEHRTESQTEDNTHTGEMMFYKNSSTHLDGKFLTKGTLFLTSFKLKLQNLQCLLFIDFSFDINILCSGPSHEFHLQQTIKNDNPVAASVVMIEDLPYLVTMHQLIDNKTVVWKMNQDKRFEVYTTYYEGDPISISTISSKKGIFLAVAYKHLENTKDYGRVIVRRYDESSQTFSIFQTIKLKTPTQILFSELPSEEIALYITTETPSDHFIAYFYEGMFGFVRKIGSSTLQKAVSIKDMTFKNQHFVIVKHDKDITVLQGVFKGSKYDEGIRLGKV